MRYLILFAALLMGCWDTAPVMLQEVVEESTPTRPKVRMIYIARDEPSIERLTCIAEDLRILQGLFADEMERHGYGRKTFDFFSDVQGKLIIEWIQPLNDDDSYYDDNWNLWIEMNARLGPISEWPDQEEGVNEIRLHLVAIEIKTWCGLGSRDYNTDSGLAYVRWNCWGGGELKGGVTLDHWHCDSDHPRVSNQWENSIVAHELGHAFGLPHDWRNGEYIMSYGSTQVGDDWISVEHPQSKFSAEAAAFFNQHRAFGPVQLQIVPGR